MRAHQRTGRGPRRFWKWCAYLFITTSLLIVLYGGRTYTKYGEEYGPEISLDGGVHPIDDLMRLARVEEKRLLSARTTGVHAAAEAYRRRHGRHPPPKFDEWIAWTEKNNVMVVEEFYDRMMDDLAPFWAVLPSQMREFASTWHFKLSVRGGKIHRWTDESGHVANWMGRWASGVESLPLHLLPDVDLAFNGRDEPMVFVPWDEKKVYLDQAERTKHLRTMSMDGSPIQSVFSPLPPLPDSRAEMHSRFWWTPYDDDESLWPLCQEACPTGSPGRNAPTPTDYTTPVNFLEHSTAYKTHQGYISNWSQAKSVCINPNIRNMHGSFINMFSFSWENPIPHSKAILNQFVPLLSGCKIHDVNSEILVPPAMQWEAFEDGISKYFSFDTKKMKAWARKQDKMIWRGVGSGGDYNESTWTRSQRHRFVAMLNSSLVAEHEKIRNMIPPAHVPGGSPNLPHNFPLVNQGVYDVAAFDRSHPDANDLASWIDSFADVRMTHLRCAPMTSWGEGDGSDCEYLNSYFEPAASMPSAEQYNYKYLPDIDGASYSGRYRSFLASNSLPIKATVYDEWHDSRLVPWRHFVPMDVSHQDLYGIMDYFLGYKPSSAGLGLLSSTQRAGHDGQARDIALNGAKWSKTVLKKEDQSAWMYRLILELARLYDERRDDMGYTADLV